MAGTAGEQAFINRMRVQANSLANVAKELNDLETMYFDRGYDSSISDDDLVEYDFVASDLGNMITLIQQLSNLLNNQTVTESNYHVPLNKVRQL